MAYSLFGERPIVAAWPTTVFRTLLRTVANLRQARRKRMALAALMEMDDYRLWDLGISRTDLNRALRAEEFDIEAVRDRRRGGIDVWPPR